MEAKGRERLLIVAAAICLGSLVCDKLILPPLANVWNERASRIAELEKLLMKGGVLAEREEMMTDRWRDMKELALPKDVSEAENQVLKAVDRWTRDSRIRLTGLKPQWKQYEDEFSTLECRATASGGLESIARFLYALETDPLALKVEEVEVSARDDRGQDLTLGLRFSGIRLLEEENDT